jgi:hypothetical protein
MQFPLSNNQLQNYRIDNILKQQIQQRQEFILKEICSGVENTIITSNKTVFIYGAERHLVFDSLRISLTAFPQHIVIDYVLKDLQLKFPDSRITLDPLKKTITIDWSDLNGKNIVKSG